MTGTVCSVVSVLPLEATTVSPTRLSNARKAKHSMSCAQVRSITGSEVVTLVSSSGRRIYTLFRSLPGAGTALSRRRENLYQAEFV